MSTSASMSLRFFGGICLVGVLLTSARGQELSLVPFSSDGPSTMNGNEIILDTPGQRVFLDVRLAGWDPNLDGVPLLKSWQTVIDSSGYASGLGGVLTPARELCTTDTECRNVFGFGSTCIFPLGIADSCAPGYIDSGFRNDYVFFLIPSLPAVDVSTLDFRFGGTVLASSVADDGQVKYGASLVLDVPADARGSYTIHLRPGDSLMTDENNNEIIPLTFSPGIITIKCQTNVDCDDGNACTGDSCQMNGTCAHADIFNPLTECCNPLNGTITLIDDSNECTDDVCDIVTGQVAHNPFTAGTLCGDPTNTECNGADSCDGAGACRSNLAGPGAPCGDPTVTDCNLADTCDGAGACRVNFVPSGTACGSNASTLCTAPDACDGSGACLTNHAPDGTPCDDNLFCNENEQCLNGLCAGGSPVNCDDGLPCTTDSCNEFTDQCDNTLNAGQCLIAGVCVADGVLNPANDCEWCDTSVSTSNWSFRDVGALCDDGDACTGTGRPGIGVDVCDGAGLCAGLIDPTCNDNCDFAVPAVEGVTVGNNDNRGPDDVEATCQPDSNNDVWFVYTASCSGLVFVSTTGSLFVPSNDPVLSVYDACPGVGGAEIACDDDSGVDLQAALTFTAVAGTSYWIRVAGFENNTGAIVLNISTVNDCVINSTCFPAGTLNPNNDCEACVPELATDTWSPVPEGSACGNGLDTECDSPDACDGLGVCESNPKPDGTVCSDDGNDCTFDVCGGGDCTHPPRPIDTACGSPLDTECDNPDSCDDAGLCRDNFETQGVACGDPTVGQCNLADVCDGLGACDINLAPAGTPCDDGDICTGNDGCQSGTCIGTPIPQAPLVAASGPRHLSITPLPGGPVPPVALRITSPDFGCLTKYVAATGTGLLIDEPVFQTPDQWGTVVATGKEIVSSALYRVEALCGGFTSDAGEATTERFGDIVGVFNVDQQQWEPPDGSVDVTDMTAIVQAFSHLETAPPLSVADIAPCTVDFKIDILDMTWVVDAFKSMPSPCPPPCP